MINSFEEGIQAMIPKYTDIGDSTFVYSLNGVGRTYNLSMKSFLKKLYYFYTIDFLAQKNKFRKMGIHQNAPILLRDQVFIKVRVRKPIGKSDGAYGYVNVDNIEKVRKKENNMVVVLKDGFEIYSLDSYSTLSKNIMIGVSIEKNL